MSRLFDAVRSKAGQCVPRLLEPNLELDFVRQYDTDVCDGIPEGHFASGNEKVFEDDHHGRIWFKFIYDETNEKLTLCLYKGRNFKKSTDESSGDRELTQKPKRRRNNSTPTYFITLTIPQDYYRDAAMTSRPPKPPFLIQRDKKNKEITITVRLYPDPRIQKRVKSYFRGLPDPVFADRVVCQVSKESIKSRTLHMVFRLNTKGSAPVFIGDITYPLQGMVLNTVVYQDMQKYSPEIPMLLPPRNAIHCELLLSLGYSNELNHCICIEDLRVCVELSKFIPDLESQIEVELYNAKESTGVSTGQWKPQQSRPSRADSSTRNTCSVHVNQFFHDSYKFRVKYLYQIDTTWMTINLRLKGQNVGEDMQGILVLGPPMFSKYGNGIYHWKDMFDNPNTVRTQSHLMILTNDPKCILFS